MAAVSNIDIADALRGLHLKELREQCRARGITPAGGLEALRARLTENMFATNDAGMRQVEQQREDADDGHFSKNNYARPGGAQNLGNRITDRPTSRVLAPPGGVSQVCFGGPSEPTPASRSAQNVLDKMGLGDTDSLLANHAAAGAPSYYRDEAPAHHKAHGDAYGHANQKLSQVSFGDHQLPSYTSAHPTESHAAPAETTDNFAYSIDAVVKPLMLKDLRAQCRARGLSPAGSMEALRQRLGEHMMATRDLTVVPEGGSFAGSQSVAAAPYGAGAAQVPDARYANNNYARPGGQQNVGNFITDRPTSRVLAPPGGNSQIFFGGDSTPQKAPAPYHPAPAPYAHLPAPQASPAYHGSPAPYGSPGPNGAFGASTADMKSGSLANNYSRPNGQQNVGNFITDRPSSRVLAPPGGKSQITFG